MPVLERIYGLESEYALNHYPEEGLRGREAETLNADELFDLLSEASKQADVPEVTVKGITTNGKSKIKMRGNFLTNAARLYYEPAGGHPEYATPECLTVRDLIIADEAGDRILERLVKVATGIMHRRGFSGELFACKNNRDTQRTTYGAHENYLVRTTEDYKNLTDFISTFKSILIPFLVTRQLMVGAGTIISNNSGNPRYQTSQRADFIDCEVNNVTTRDRPILHIREEPHSGPKYIRFQLLLGDANMSRVSKALKFGTTGIVLQLLENGIHDFYLPGTKCLPYIKDPVGALRAISKNPRAEIYLRQSRNATAIDIQEVYLSKAEENLELLSDEQRQIATLWRKTLEAFKTDDPWLSKALDWKIKEAILAHHLRRLFPEQLPSKQKGSLNTLLDKLPRSSSSLKDAYTQLVKRELCYHDIRTETGLFHLLRANGFIQDDVFSIDEEEILQAINLPPGHTRARTRYDFLKAMAEHGLCGEANWMEGKARRYEDKLVPVAYWPDPFSGEFDLEEILSRFAS
ncbi:MAG: proteasome accessory factor PafA2 family protein [Nanoarchaeota archaeon]